MPFSRYRNPDRDRVRRVPRSGIVNLVLALSLGGWVGYARLVRARCSPFARENMWKRREPWAQMTCASSLRHILPNIIQPLIVQAAIGMAGAVLAEAT